MRPLRRLSVRILLALAIGAAEPFVELAIKCRDAVSEACVWGHAFLSLSVGAGLAVVAPIAFVVLTAAAALTTPRRDDGGAEG